MRKLDAAVIVYAGLATVDPIRQGALDKLANMLLHPFSKVRLRTLMNEDRYAKLLDSSDPKCGCRRVVHSPAAGRDEKHRLVFTAQRFKGSRRGNSTKIGKLSLKRYVAFASALPTDYVLSATFFYPLVSFSMICHNERSNWSYHALLKEGENILYSLKM